jgi:hypothetical protein
MSGVRVHQSTKLNPRESITLTKEGRRHLADEMKKISKPQQPYSSSDASSFILKKLLAEFRERKLTTSDLQQGYEGLLVTKLKELAAVSGICDVEFDLALNDLEDHHLVKTGPMDVAGGHDSRDVIFVPLIYSKREYLCLTGNGYREVTRIDFNADRLKTGFTGEGGRTVVRGDQYVNYGQAGAIGPHSTGTINYQQQWAAIQNQVDFNALAGELEQLRKHLMQGASSSSDFRQLGLLAEAEEHAKKHEGSKTMEILSKLGKGLLGVAKEISTDVAAKVIAK